LLHNQKMQAMIFVTAVGKSQAILTALQRHQATTQRWELLCIPQRYGVVEGQ